MQIPLLRAPYQNFCHAPDATGHSGQKLRQRHSFGQLWQIPVCLLALVWGASAIRAERLEFGTRNQPAFGKLSLTGVRIVRGTDATPDLTLRPSSHSGDPKNLLHLSFDEEVPAQLRDTTGNYRLNRISYYPSADARVGRRAGLFIRKENRLVVRSPQELWPGRDILDDFTIDFWMKPVHFGHRNILFRKRSLSAALEQGRNAGFEIYVQDSRLHVLYRSLFYDLKGRSRSVHLVSRRNIQLREWQHVLVSYTAASGRVALYLGGREEQVALAKDKGGIWQARFGRLDRSPLVIGESYLGLLDEFRISRGAPGTEQDIRNSVYPALRYHPVVLNAEQPMGVAQSAVIALARGRLARKADLMVSTREPRGAALNFYVRSSAKPFTAQTPAHELPWRSVRGRARLMDFAYVQWKAEFRAEPTGEQAPTLRSIRLSYTPYPRPVAPQAPAVVEGLSGSRRIGLEWLANPEPEVRRNGGYIVYYGYKPGEYLGQIRFDLADDRLRPINSVPLEELPLTAREQNLKKQRPRSFQKELTNRVRLVLSNRVIERNLIAANDPGQSESPKRPTLAGLPLLQTNRTYYVAISAYYKTRSGTVLESKLSKEIIAVLRPWTRPTQTGR